MSTSTATRPTPTAAAVPLSRPARRPQTTARRDPAEVEVPEFVLRTDAEAARNRWRLAAVTALTLLLVVLCVWMAFQI